MTNSPSKRLIHNTDAAIAVEDIMHGCQHVVERDDSFFIAERAIHARFDALAGMDPAKLATLLESIDYMKRGYELWLAPECPPEEVGSPSWLERQERVFAALAELRGEEAHRG